MEVQLLEELRKLEDLQTIDSIYVDFGDRLLSEEDVKTLNAAISQIRNNVITVN